MKQVLWLAAIALAPQFVFAAKPISIHTNFEGAALGKIVRVVDDARFDEYSGKAWKCLTASGKSKVIASGAILPFTIKTIFRGQNQ
jgi:hypothetical protein